MPSIGCRVTQDCYVIGQDDISSYIFLVQAMLAGTTEILSSTMGTLMTQRLEFRKKGFSPCLSCLLVFSMFFSAGGSTQWCELFGESKIGNQFSVRLREVKSGVSKETARDPSVHMSGVGLACRISR